MQAVNREVDHNLVPRRLASTAVKFTLSCLLAPQTKKPLTSDDASQRLRFGGAEGRIRTDTELPQLDFESNASTNFATPAAHQS